MFEVRERDGLGRIGQLTTPHGKLATPALLPVVNPNRLTISPVELKDRFGFTGLITNSYIIHKHERLRERALAVGVHELLGFDGMVMTDSGTFQAYVYGKEGVAPQEILEFQAAIGTDIATLLDVFSTPDRTRDEAAKDVAETHQRAKAAGAWLRHQEHLRKVKGDQQRLDTPGARGLPLLAATVQGSIYPALRHRAAAGLSRLNGDVHPIGGVVPLMEQYRYGELAEVIIAAKKGLTPARPVHLFGCGHPLVLPLAALLGCDMFDSASYAKYASQDRLLFPEGTRHLKDLVSLPCSCPVCSSTEVDDLRALPSIERTKKLAEHNLWVLTAELKSIHQAIAEGWLWELTERRLRSHPALLPVFKVLARHQKWLAHFEPVTRNRSWQPTGRESVNRAGVLATRRRLKPMFRTRRKCFDHSVLGPVPLSLCETHPCQQSPEIPEREQPRAPLWTPYRAKSIAAFQFGIEGARTLFAGGVELICSRKTKRLRNVMSTDGEHLLSLRAADGLYTLKLAGAERLIKALRSPSLRVVVEGDAMPFVADGRSVFAKFVTGCDPGLRARDECLVVGPKDELIGVGRCRLNPQEMRAFDTGVAAKVREGVGRSALK